MPHRRLTSLIIAALCLLAGACGDGSILGDTTTGAPVDGLPAVDLEASQQFVLASADRTTALPYRFEASLSMVIDVDIMRIEVDGDEPVMRGTFDGERTWMHMDIGVMFEDMAESEPMLGSMLDELGAARDMLVMEAILDDTVMYIHAPMFGIPLLSSELPGDLGYLAHGWGRVDLASLPQFGIDDLSSMTGASGLDPSAVLDILRSVGVDVRDDGSERVNGVDTTRLLAPATLTQLLEAQGGTSGMLDGFGFDDGSLLDTTVDIVVNIDGQGLVRRVSYDIDLGEWMSAMAPAEMGGLFGDVEMRIGMELDFLDYGHTEVVLPPSDARDIGPALRGLFSLAA